MSKKTTTSYLLIPVLSLFVAFSSFASKEVPYQNDWLKAHYQHRLALFSTQPVNQGDIVFIGDSLTELGANWAVRFENLKVRNRGIRGDTTYGVLARLDELKQSKPSAVFLLIGINDIFNIVYENQIEKLSDTATNINKIAKQLKSSLPNTQIFVLGLLPDHRDFITVMAKEVNNQLSSQESENFTFINFHDLLSVDGTMNAKLTTDGTHLNEEGYKIWKKALQPYLDNLK
ncbi:hypothetical protein KUC3_20850 [Alteromonas sp. KC3]|jgi:lysophospholipase L1-like esterase|uniref:GDSL-type esterase/lipase family protein n=1 Tax=unclassified Alteromonas TaxID=2614992 RepID=UPI001923FAD1|nr:MULTISPECIES: GDSL-type esterase/lipase family protein [unclassified Alteromonas]BCO19228.1 hypothetical protein KUC3_20850 [Alteromonas sp. KC3]BCO23188.1 hypothetical protein KUC14_20570 [Alteromonas sp. KC14]